MKVTIIGYKGRLGATLHSILSKSGHTIIGTFDRGDVVDRQKVSESDVTILAVPIEESMKLIGELSECGTLIEVSSVKEPIEGFRNRVISIHPLFGPSSANSSDFRTVLHVSDVSPEGSLQTITALFPDRNVISLTAAEHDRAMADLLVMPYIVSRISGAVNEKHEFDTPSHSMIDRISHILDGENAGVVKDTISRNRYSVRIIDGIENELQAIRGELN